MRRLPTPRRRLIVAAACLTTMLAPRTAPAQTPALDRFLPAARRVEGTAALTSDGTACYQRREALHDAVEALRRELGPAAAIAPSGRQKVDKDWNRALVARIVEAGGRGTLTERATAFQQFATDVVDQLAARCPALVQPAGLDTAGPDPEDWEEFRDWKAFTTSLAQSANAWALDRFEVRYGGGETLNWAEVYLDNLVQRAGLAGATDFRPSRLEPILRLTPLVYFDRTEEVISIGEVGANLYAFGGVMRTLNPVGLAFVLANPRARHPFKGLFYAGDLEPGFMLHARKLEIGALRGDGGAWRLISTVNLQVVKGVF